MLGSAPSLELAPCTVSSVESEMELAFVDAARSVSTGDTGDESVKGKSDDAIFEMGLSLTGVEAMSDFSGVGALW
jgi:hypothetical protein